MRNVGDFRKLIPFLISCRNFKASVHLLVFPILLLFLLSSNLYDLY